jgi:hypothetical protein
MSYAYRLIKKNNNNETKANEPSGHLAHTVCFEVTRGPWGCYFLSCRENTASIRLKHQILSHCIQEIFIVSVEGKVNIHILNQRDFRPY